MGELDIQVNYGFSKDYELEIMNINASVELIEFHARYNEKITLIGNSRMYLFNPLLFDDWIDMVVEADAVSGDLQKVVIEMESYYEEKGIMGTVVVIDGFEINENFRKKGYGVRFLRKVLDDLYFMNVELVGLIPGYYGEASQESLVKNNKIQDFYKKSGFKIVNSENSTPVMAKCLHYQEVGLDI